VNAVVLQNVVKRYGTELALNGLSLVIPRGSICALIGPNGCGKTTTMGVIAGLLKIESGSVDVLGSGPFNASKHAGRVSLMPQDAVPSVHVSILDNLRYYAELQGFNPASAKREAEASLAKVKLQDRAQARFGQLSHGMRRRFSIAQAMLGSPELVLLDEPTSGLDPELVVQMRELIVGQRREATMLVSSHILSELEAMCDHAIFVEQGKVVRQGSMAELTSANTIVRYTLARKPAIDSLELRLQGCTLAWQEPVLTVRAPRSQPIEKTNALCLRELLDQEVGILQLDTGHSLETAYLELKRGQ
jgi:ABC-type multidrug transport system ATPase subunit